MIYSSFYWLVFIRLKIVNLNYIIFGGYVPLGISTVLIWFYFRKKLQLLDTTDKYKQFTLIISWVLLTAPVLTFQFYLNRETGELAHLKNVDEIFKNKPTMYYSIDHSFQHMHNSGVFVAEASVNRGTEIGVGCYFACLLTNKEDSIWNTNVWIVTMIGERFSNRVFDNKEKQGKLISQFINSSMAVYNKYKYQTTFLRRISDPDEREDYLNAIQQTRLPVEIEKLIILKEEDGNYQSRAGSSLWWTIFTFIASNVIWTFLTIQPLTNCPPPKQISLEHE